MNRIVTFATAAAFALSLSASPSFAKDHLAKSIAGIVALGIIGAAIAKDQHRNGHQKYSSHPQVGYKENAVGHCMHRVKRLVDNANGYAADLDHVKHVRKASNGGLKVTMVVTGYYDFGHKTSDVICTVHNGRITNFSYN